MQSPFRYPGGKSRKTAREWIIGHAPDNFSEYREPFVGGGGIFFGVSPKMPRWINDRDEFLVSVYQALRDDPHGFIERCRSVPTYKVARDVSKKGEVRKREYARLERIFKKVAFDSDEDSAFRFFFVNRTVFAGRVNYERPSRLYFSKPEGWTDEVITRLWQAAVYMQGVRISSGDYETLLSTPGDNVWVYCDPPYVKPFTSTTLLYRHNFMKKEDHERLAECVRQSPHKVCVSYEDDKDGLVRSLYRGFDIREKSWTYAGSWDPDEDGVDKKKQGKELLILNYEHRDIAIDKPPGRRTKRTASEPISD